MPPCRFRARFAGRRSRWGVPNARSGRSLLVQEWCRVRVLVSWGPLLVPSSLYSPATGKPLGLPRFFRGYGSGFLPPTVGRSFIGGTSAWASPLLRVTAISLAFGLATAVFRCGGGFTLGYGWWPVFPSFGSGRRRRLSTLDAFCIDRNLFPVNPGLF